MPTCCAYWLPGIPRQSNEDKQKNITSTTYYIQRRLYRYNHIQVHVRDENSCQHAVRTGCPVSHGKAASKSHHNNETKKRAPVVHCLVIQLHSHRRLLAPLYFQPHSRRRLLLPLCQLCQVCCSFPLLHQQCCCQLHEYRLDCPMHYLLVPESQRSATYALLSHSPSSRLVRRGRIFCLVSWTQPGSFHLVVDRLASYRSLLAESLGVVELGSGNRTTQAADWLSLHDSFNGTPIKGVSFTSFFLVITSNTSI